MGRTTYWILFCCTMLPITSIIALIIARQVKKEVNMWKKYLVEKIQEELKSKRTVTISGESSRNVA